MSSIRALCLTILLTCIAPIGAALAEEQVTGQQPATTADAAVQQHGAAVEAAAAHSSGGLPQFDFTSWPSQIFWLVVFFIVLYTIFSKAVLPAIGNTMETRKGHIDGNLAEAEALSQKAAQIEANLKAELKKAAKEASDIIHAAEQETKDKMDQALAGFREKYEQEISAAEARIAGAKQIALQEMESSLADIASVMVEKMTGDRPDRASVEQALRQIGTAPSREAA